MEQLKRFRIQLKEPHWSIVSERTFKQPHVIFRGKRMGVYGAFLLAVYNQEAEEFQSISKIGTGFSEEQLKQFSEQLKELTVPSPKPYYRYLKVSCTAKLTQKPSCTLLTQCMTFVLLGKRTPK